MLRLSKNKSKYYNITLAYQPHYLLYKKAKK